MKKITIADIRSWDPCYDPIRYLPEDWEGTAIDILNHDSIPHDDKLWCVLRTELMTERTMRLFAVWCARQVQHLMTDKRSLDALDVAERFANGEATRGDLAAAWDAARAAAWDAARAAAWDAARGAAWDAARAAAWDAARGAARDAARAAAWGAARAAARAAAWDAARGAQRTKLIEMIQAEDK